MSSYQKVIQLYLHKHDIAHLFEDMMAKLVKEMPNEPVVYLIKLLQKIQPKKVIDMVNPVPNNEIKLTGSSIPKKYSQDPQVILPGSKPSVSIWSKGVDDEEKDISHHVVHPEKVKKPKENVNEVQDWKNGKMKVKTDIVLPNSTNDGLFHSSKEQNDVGMKRKDNKSPMLVQNSDVNDELDINPKTKTKKISSSTYTKFKKHSSKKKSVEQKKKLQALLSIEKQDEKHSVIKSDEEIVENNLELISEGIQVQSTKPLKDTSAKVKIGLCQLCNRLLNSSDKKNVPESDLVFDTFRCNKIQNEQISSEDEEFDSISQYKFNTPKWPTLSDSEGELFDTETFSLSMGEKGSIRTEGALVQRLKNTSKSDQSDFFKMNNPSRKKVEGKFPDKKVGKVTNSNLWNVKNVEKEEDGSKVSIAS